MSSQPSEIRELVYGMQLDQIEAVEAALEPVLEGQRLRIEYAETRRAAIGVLGGVVLAAGLAGLIQLAGADVAYKPALVGLLMLTATLALTGLLVLVIYGRQTNWSYPFKENQASTWKWFYRDAIPKSSKVKPRWDAHQSSDFRERSQQAFIDSRAPLAEKVISLADPKINLLQDLEQAHLLHWNEFYKNRFLADLRSILITGVSSSIVLSVLAFLATLAMCG